MSTPLRNAVPPLAPDQHREQGRSQRPQTSAPCSKSESRRTAPPPRKKVCCYPRWCNRRDAETRGWAVGLGSKYRPILFFSNKYPVPGRGRGGENIVFL